MKATKLKEVLTKCILGREPVLVKGAPGVGKSDIVTQISEENNLDLLITHPVVSEPIDYQGLPAIVEGKAEFLPYGHLRRMINTKKPLVVFLDDLGQAPACVQAACMQLLLARTVGDKKISDKVTFVAATNRRQDRAGVTGMLEPVKSRFITIYELVADADSWIEWALTHNQPSDTVGFAHFRPGLFTSFKATTDISNSFCPRTLANAGRLIKLGLDDIESISGAIGEGAAAELCGFIKIRKQLPPLNKIIEEPDKVPVPDEPGALYAVASGLVEKATRKNFANILKYGNRMSAEYSTLLVRDCIRRDETLQHSKAFINWTVKHKDILTF